MMNLRYIAGLAAIIAMALMISGCSPSATSQQESASKQVSRWKTHSTNKSSVVLGLVLEKEGKNVDSKLYVLKNDDGFVIKEELAAGKYLSERKAFVLIPSGIPMLSSLEEWIEVNGPHFLVPIRTAPTNLVATINAPGMPGLPTEFWRYRE